MVNPSLWKPRYINDIVDNHGNYLKLDALNRKYKSNVSVMEYNSMKDAIPKNWRKSLKGSAPVCIGLPWWVHYDTKLFGR